MSDADPDKDQVVDLLTGGGSAVAKYQTVFVGRRGLWPLLRHEFAMHFAATVGGALGFALRKLLFPGLFARVGSGTVFGRGLILRCPGRIVLGERLAIDDNCTLDGRGATGPDDFMIGDGSLIARDTVLLVKSGYLRIGKDCSIGAQSFLGSVSGIEIGDHAIIAGQCYFGGGRYYTTLGAGPMVKQGIYSKGPVVVGSDVWIGAGARILDGVRIGDGSIVGAGSVVTGDVAPGTIVAGIPARKIGSRGAA